MLPSFLWSGTPLSRSHPQADPVSKRHGILAGSYQTSLLWAPGGLHRKKKVFLEQARNTLEVLSQTEGPILTLCASCLWMFKKVYPLVFSDTKEEKKVHSVAQRVEEALSHLSPKVSTWPFQVDDLAMHIPCHLKEFKTQIPFQGSQINLCCGSVTPKRLLFENQLPKSFLEKLMELGPSLLVTACTGCYLKLRKLLKVPPEVKHWAELLSV